MLNPNQNTRTKVLFYLVAVLRKQGFTDTEIAEVLS